MQSTRTAQSVGALQKEAGNLWLKSAKIARKAGYFQAAYSAILHAAKVDPPYLEVERAKWLWKQGDKHRAMTDLHRFVKPAANAVADATGTVGSAGQTVATQAAHLDKTSDKFVRAKVVFAPNGFPLGL